jgi:hypothetical protein
MKSALSNVVLRLKRISLLGLTLACSSILLVTAGSLVLCSCATTEAGLAREERIHDYASNAVYYARPVAAIAPQPFATALEGILAAGGALLALWATHIHRSVAEVKKANGTAPKPPPPTPQAGLPS